MATCQKPCVQGRNQQILHVAVCVPSYQRKRHRKDGDGLSISGWVTNLTDNANILSGYTDFAFTGHSQASYARPREWFLRPKSSF